MGIYFVSPLKRRKMFFSAFHVLCVKKKTGIYFILYAKTFKAFFFAFWGRLQFFSHHHKSIFILLKLIKRDWAQENIRMQNNARSPSATKHTKYLCRYISRYIEYSLYIVILTKTFNLKNMKNHQNSETRFRNISWVYVYCIVPIGNIDGLNL